MTNLTIEQMGILSQYRADYKKAFKGSLYGIPVMVMSAIAFGFILFGFGLSAAITFPIVGATLGFLKHRQEMKAKAERIDAFLEKWPTPPDFLV